MESRSDIPGNPSGGHILNFYYMIAGGSLCCDDMKAVI